MTNAYMGEIRWLAVTLPHAPYSWLECDGSLLQITEFSSLYRLIGTAYGGDGIRTFALPDLRGRVPLHQGTGPGLSPRPLGAIEGVELVTLDTTQINHIHYVAATAAGAVDTMPPQPAPPQASPPVTVAVVDAGDTLFCSGDGTSRSAVLGASSIAPFGSGLPHENCAPTMPIRAFICIDGIFPTHH